MAQSSAMEIRDPDPMLHTSPPDSGASHAMRLAATQSSTKVKSRDYVPSPKMVAALPRRQCMMKRGITAALGGRRVLSGAIHVEVAQADGRQPVGVREDSGRSA